MTDPGDRATLPSDLRLGPAVLRVVRLERSLEWYGRVLGLRAGPSQGRGTPLHAAGDPDPVLLLEEHAGAAPAGRHAGLFHVCLLYPTRDDLARAALRLARTGEPATGASDHGTHEAIYLRDPDGLGLELAADRPREAWPDVRSPAGYAGGPEPLDLRGLLATIAGEDVRPAADPGVRIGHVHLHVGDVRAGVAHYCGLLGFELMVDLGSAAFVSAGGYHHHLAFNTWNGEGVGPAPAGAVGLERWTIELPDADAMLAVRGRTGSAGSGPLLVRDPWGIAVEFRVAAG